MNLTKKDFLIIWGGTKEVNRSETQKGPETYTNEPKY
jgi:hypothetical protein